MFIAKKSYHIFSFKTRETRGVRNDKFLNLYLRSIPRKNSLLLVVREVNDIQGGLGEV